jgi:hypothetical protein
VRLEPRSALSRVGAVYCRISSSLWRRLAEQGALAATGLRKKSSRYLHSERNRSSSVNCSAEPLFHHRAEFQLVPRTTEYRTDLDCRPRKPRRMPPSHCRRQVSRPPQTPRRRASGLDTEQANLTEFLKFTWEATWVLFMPLQSFRNLSKSLAGSAYLSNGSSMTLTRTSGC